MEFIMKTAAKKLGLARIIKISTPTDEHYWRLSNDGTWSVCHAHRTPWVNKEPNLVPNEILAIAAVE